MSENSGAQVYFDLWATAWGPMGAVAGPNGIKRIILPHYQFKDLGDLLAWETPGAVRDEKPFRQLAEITRDYFNGKPADFSQVACEAPGGFAGQVLAACRAIPYGRTRSYSSLAEQIGRPDAARAVAAALGKNPIPLVIPCHRVTYSDGRLGGFSAPAGTELKKRMLDVEKRNATANG